MNTLNEKEIRKLCQNDISLREIAPKEMLLANENNILCEKLPKTFFDEDVKYRNNAFDIDNLVHYFFYSVSNGNLTSALEFYNLPKDFKDPKEILDNTLIAFDIVKAKYIEYFSGLLGLKTSVNTRSYGNCIDSIKTTFTFTEHYRNAFKDTYKFLLGCIFVCKELYKAGKLTNKMTEYEKARVLYNWVILHTNYDISFKEYSYSGYSALYYGYAVCQGFTALFNMLCKLNGIVVVGMSGESKSPTGNSYENHIWSYIILDGKYTYIDVTWGKPIFINENRLKRDLNIDTKLMCDFSFFDMSRRDLELEHRWDKKIYG